MEQEVWQFQGCLSQRFDDIFKGPGAVCLCSLLSLLCGRCLPSWHKVVADIPGDTWHRSKKRAFSLTCMSCFISNETFPWCPQADLPQVPLDRAGPCPWSPEGKWDPVGLDLTCFINWSLGCLSRTSGRIPKEYQASVVRTFGGGA